MVVTQDVSLPEYETLETPEVNLSTPMLIAAAPYLGKQCENINNEFMLCRQETNDARACIDLGKRVTACAMQVFKNIKANCRKEFEQYANCVDKSSDRYKYSECRVTQSVFDDCMEDATCLKRPHYGYFCRGRIHTTVSAPPPPPPCPCSPKFSDATPELPDCKPRPPARLGSRFYWITE